MLRKVAITGGLASGKSLACHFFQKLGAYVINADEIVHQLLSVETPIGQQVVDLLGKEIIVNGQINRTIIAKKVFNNSVLLRSLEEILHPSVLNEIEKQYQQIKIQGQAPLFIAEVPLLFEIGAETCFDATIAVIANKNCCQTRFKTATGNEEIEYDKRMAFQLSQEEKIQRADYVIENSGSVEEMQNAVKKLFQKLES